ncbi:MAG TPA: DMT family transporter [Bacillales bacterium]|nr:DMT family transporter [Bacillales bacterium]
MAQLATYGLLVFIMMVWGLNVIAIKILVQHFPPVLITSLRIFLAGMIVFLLLIFQKRLRPLTKKESFYAVAGSLLGMVGNQFFLAVGLDRTSASSAALILALIPLATSVLAMVFLGDRLTVLRFVGILSGLAGISLVITQGNGGLGGLSLGSLYIFGAMLSQSFSFIWINKLTETLDAREATAVMLTFGSVLLFVISLFMDPHGVHALTDGSLGVWTVFVLSAVVATALGQMIYNLAIHRLGAGKSAIFMNLTPLFSLVGSALLLGETIRLPQIVGFLFIVAGVLLGTGYLEQVIARKNDDRTVIRRRDRSV